MTHFADFEYKRIGENFQLLPLPIGHQWCYDLVFYFILPTGAQMTNQELELFKLMREESPVMAFLFSEALSSGESTQFLLALLRDVQGLPQKWRADFPGSDVAERCASELEAIVIAKRA